MAWRDATVGQSVVMVVNGAVRAAQAVTGILTIFLYASECGYWLDHSMPSKVNFEIAIGSFAIITGLALGLIPFKLSYRIAALACPWDLVMFFMYSAAFGYMRDFNKKLGTGTNPPDHAHPNDYTLFLAHIRSMHDKVWINLAGMLLFLGSAIMGGSLLWKGRRDAKSCRVSAV